MSWQEEQSELKRRQYEHRDKVNKLIQDVHELIFDHSLDVSIEALQVVLRGLYRLKDESKK